MTFRLRANGRHFDSAVGMPPPFFSGGRRWLAAAVLAAAAAAWWYSKYVMSTGFGIEVARNIPAPPEPAPLCPWRNPAADIAAFFPGGTAGRTQLLVLSGERAELGKLLGHTPSAEEHALYIYPIMKRRTRIGTVIARRLKGEYGAIEVVAGVDVSGKLRGVHIQRIREPAAITDTLTSSSWLSRFDGLTASSHWVFPGEDVPAACRPTARVVWDGVRTIVIALDLAQRQGLTIQL